MNKKITIFIIWIISIIIFICINQNSKTNNSEDMNNIVIKIDNNIEIKDNTKQNLEYDNDVEFLTSKEEISLYDLDGNGEMYSFTYKGESFTAIYSSDNWHIIDSFKIKNINDITIICQALIDKHKIHGKDMISYRTAEDMAYEWLQHNIVYEILPEDNPWKVNAKDVDLNPEDQGRNLKEMYEARTGKN